MHVSDFTFFLLSLVAAWLPALPDTLPRYQLILNDAREYVQWNRIRNTFSRLPPQTTNYFVKNYRQSGRKGERERVVFRLSLAVRQHTATLMFENRTSIEMQTGQFVKCCSMSAVLMEWERCIYNSHSNTINNILFDPRCFIYSSAYNEEAERDVDQNCDSCHFQMPFNQYASLRMRWKLNSIGDWISRFERTDQHHTAVECILHSSEQCARTATLGVDELWMWLFRRRWIERWREEIK